MDVWLLRSSIPQDEGAPPEHRHLSAEGRRTIRALGTLLKKNEDPSFAVIVTSPHPSCVQTAELFADRVDHTGMIEVVPGLATGVSLEILVPPLLSRGDAIAIVADEPALSSIGAFLVSRPSFPQFMHAQVSVLRDRQPAWRLRPGDLARHQLLLM